VLASLRDNELDESEEASCVVAGELLILAELDELLLIVSLAHHLAQYLLQNELQFNGADLVQLDYLR
jgi:hypothetical protein